MECCGHQYTPLLPPVPHHQHGIHYGIHQSLAGLVFPPKDAQGHPTLGLCPGELVSECVSEQHTFIVQAASYNHA